MTSGPGAFLLHLRRAADWHRRLLAAGLAAAAVAFTIQASSPSPPRLASVLVAARDLPGGTWLRAGDLRSKDLPTAAVPEQALTAEPAAVGQLLASAMRAGEALTDVRLVDSALLGSLPAGQIAAPVRVTDSDAAGLLHAGDLVDVVAAAPGSQGGSRAVVVAPAVRVLAIPAPSPTPGSTEGALVLLGVGEDVALALAKAAVSARLSVLLRPD